MFFSGVLKNYVQYSNNTVNYDTIQYGSVVRYRSVAHLYNIYNNVTSMHFHWYACMQDTHMASNSRQITSADFCFSCPISLNKPFEFLLYKTNSLHFPVCVYCNRSQNMSQLVKNNSHSLDFGRCCTFWFFTGCDVICDLLQYTHIETCNIFVKYIHTSVIYKITF